MSDRQLIQVPAQVVNLYPKSDRSWKLIFETRELTGDEVKILADNFQGEGWLLFNPNKEVNPAQIPEDSADAGVKSPAKRLRDKIYHYWVELGRTDDFDAFYRTQIEKVIEVFDSKIS